MQKSIFVYFFLFVVYLFHLSVPNAVFGQSLSQLGLNEYKGIFQRSDIHKHFPDLLEAFQTDKVQRALSTNVINFFVNDPRRLRAYYSDVDDSIIAFLSIDEDFQALFRDKDFHDILQDSGKIGELIGAIQALDRIDDPSCPVDIPPPDPPQPTTLSIVSGYGQEDLPGSSLSRPFVVEVKDQYGNVFSGATVVFRVTEGEGTVSSTTARPGNPGQFQATLTFDDSSAGATWVVASVSGTSLQQTFTATATTSDEPSEATTLSIVSGFGQEGQPGSSLSRPFVVEVKDQYGKPFSDARVSFNVTRGHGSLPLTTARPGNPGQFQATLTFDDSSAGATWVVASVSGTSLQQTFTATAIERVTVGSKPTVLRIVSGNNQRGEPNTQLHNPFVVSVLDQEGEPRVGIGVTFEITMGSGTLLDASAITNSNGLAQATLNLGDREGKIRVKASVVGISEDKTFTAEVASQVESPFVYWISDGMLHCRSTDGQTQVLVEKPKKGKLTGGLTVDMGQGWVYWTEQMGRNMGKIRRIRLEGKRDKQLVVKTDSVPNGIAVDAEGEHVYWTTSDGKIQRVNVNDKLTAPVITGLKSPGHIAFDHAEDRLYWTSWTEKVGHRIRYANSDGTNRRLVKNRLDELGGIAVANGTVYWTEQTNNGPGKVRSVNASGSGEKLLAVLESIPEGIAVDAVDGRLYWTTSIGKIQSAPLTGTIQDIVSGGNERVDAAGIALGRTSVGSTNGITSAPAAPIAMRPEGSALLANYPNPFNPETWIPYQLSQSADVTVSIYSVNGHLIRTLALGHRAAGVYRNRSRAAYWDGRNEFGERIASGLYFYTLTAGDFTATRKMLIRK